MSNSLNHYDVAREYLPIRDVETLISSICLDQGMSVDLEVFPSRESLCNFAEKTITSFDRFASHLNWLVNLPSQMFSDGFEDADINRFAEEGISTVDFECILRLLLTPTALSRLRNIVVEELPAPWLDVVDQIGDSDSNEFFERQIPSEAHVVWEKRTTTVSPLTVFDHFSRRLDQLGEAIEQLGTLSSIQYDALLTSLINVQRKLSGTKGLEFRKLDVEFHRLIVEVTSPRFEPSKIEFILEYGNPEEMTDSHRAQVCLEHDQILSRLKARDFVGALTASNRHLKASLARWMPNVMDEISAKNQAYFDDLRAGDGLVVSSVNVLPLEFEERKCRRAAFEAVARGAHLYYLHPSEELLHSLSDMCGDDHLKSLSANSYSMAFDHFKYELTSYLNEHGSSNKTAFDRLHCIELDDEGLFVNTRTNSTIGLFSYGGSLQMTYRDTLSNSKAWFGIRNDPENESNARLFCGLARRGLRKLPSNQVPQELANLLDITRKRFDYAVSIPNKL